eukprot:9035057-Alexandrium_andersonii.AAC.1
MTFVCFVCGVCCVRARPPQQRGAAGSRWWYLRCDPLRAFCLPVGGLLASLGRLGLGPLPLACLRLGGSGSALQWAPSVPQRSRAQSAVWWCSGGPAVAMLSSFLARG